MKLDNLLNIVVTLSMLALVAVAVSRELDGSATPSTSMDPNAPTEQVDEWNELIENGVPLGPLDAPIVIAIFEDLQCPFCKHFHEEVLRPVMLSFPGEITPVLVHYPIPNHAFAYPAARALECAVRQGAAAPFVDQVFQDQASLGVIEWEEYARRSGVGDVKVFAACTNEAGDVGRIAQGTSLGQMMLVAGTPTVIVNGMRFSRPPSLERLSKFVDSVLAPREAQ